MALVVPDDQEVEVLINRLTPPLTIKIYGNDKTPAHGDAAAAYTEIAGGGYVAQALLFANWTITAADPSLAIYNVTIEWIFTGPINAPGSVYGYFVTRDSDGKLMFADRFPSANVPFAPVVGSVIRVLPRYTCQSQF